MIKYDTIIIGGGLAGLTCAIRLAEKGQRCAIISAGQNTLSNSSASFNLLNALPNGSEVINPIEAISSLPPNHPYTLIGKANCLALAQEAQLLLNRANIPMIGSPLLNHKRLTPMGGLHSCWLSLNEHHIELKDHNLPWKRVAVFNFIGFMDFNPFFAVSGLKKLGTECKVCKISLPAISTLRRNASEMRASNISRVFADDSNLEATAKIICDNAQDCEAVLLPAVFGLKNQEAFEKLKTLVNKPISLLPTLPPSVPGIRITEQLMARFRSLGGTIMQGDSVTEAIFQDNRIDQIHTLNHADVALKAKHYVLCSGDFFSRGLLALSDQIEEPVFHADVSYAGDSTTWCAPDFFSSQPYQSFGVKTDSHFHMQKSGINIDNLYAAGAILSSFNALKEGCGAGVAMLSALTVANHILNSNEDESTRE